MVMTARYDGRYFKTINYDLKICSAFASVINYDRKLWHHNLECLSDDSRVVIYDRNMFTIQATGNETFYGRNKVFIRSKLESLPLSVNFGLV